MSVLPTVQSSGKQNKTIIYLWSTAYNFDVDQFHIMDVTQPEGQYYLKYFLQPLQLATII